MTQFPIGIFGIVAILAIAWLLSSNRRAIRLRTVGAAFALQAGIAVLVLRTSWGQTALHTLSNGVRVVCDPMPGLRTLALTVAVRGGAKWETEATSGWSHCLEHLVFKGAGDMGARDIVERIEAEGGSINAATGYERTSFDVRALAGSLPLAMQVVSDLLIFAETPTNPELAALRTVAPPAAFSNNHLGYAVTWFGLALVLAGFYVAMVMRRFRKAPDQA